jgi:hypothetical protein
MQKLDTPQVLEWVAREEISGYALASIDEAGLKASSND